MTIPENNWVRSGLISGVPEVRIGTKTRAGVKIIHISINNFHSKIVTNIVDRRNFDGLLVFCTISGNKLKILKYLDYAR